MGVFVGALGALVGAAVGVVLTVSSLSSTQDDALVWIISAWLLASVGACLGGGVAYWFWRLIKSAND